MPKFPKPFFRTARKAWFVQVDGKQVNLGPDQDEAMRRYHKLLGSGGSGTRRVAAIAVLPVLDEFLEWCRNNKAGRTYDWYRAYLESFADAIPTGITTDELKPLHVQKWLDANPSWKTGKRGAVIAVQRAMNWAVRMGLIETSPIRSIEKPAAGRREHVISAEQFEKILALIGDEEFRDLINVCWETGCRPQEAVSVSAGHVDLEEGCWEFPVAESKGKKHRRIVYMTDAASAIVRRRMAAHKSGPLFVNTDGMPWSASALNCRFTRLRSALGRAQLQKDGLTPPKLKRLTQTQRNDPTVREAHLTAVGERRRQITELAERRAPRYSLYTFRHSWCTHALERGVDAVTVAVLMGHRDTTMISRVYSHLMQRRDHLRDAVRKAVGA